MNEPSYVKSVRRRLFAYFGGWRLLPTAIALGALAGGPLLPAPWSVLMTATGVAALLLLLGVTGSRLRQLEDRIRAAPAVPESTHQPPTPLAAELLPRPEVGHDPLVTVAVISHNDGAFIADCLRSLQQQTWDAFECIVVDDCSTDRSLEIAMDAVEGDDRYRFLQTETRSGVAAARNAALEAATAEYITFLDADDYLFRRSLETRLAGLLEVRGDDLPVAGIYCDWVGVPELHELVPEGRPAHERSRITWLGALDGAPVINSAPMLLTAIVRQLGGYRDSAAEDAEFWNRLLRHGYVLEPVAYNGVAYRQKQRSRFRSSALQHAQAMVAISQSNRAHLTDRVADTPFVFAEPAPDYQLRTALVTRLLMSLATASSAGDRAAATELVDLIHSAWLPFMPAEIDVNEILRRAAMRHEAHRDEGREVRAGQVVASAMELIGGLSGTTTDHANLSSSEFRSGVPVRPVRPRVRAPLASEQLSRAIAGTVVMMPAVEYHVTELGLLAEALEQRGRRAVFLVSDRRWPDVQSTVRWFDIPVYRCPEPGAWVSSAAAYVTLNDWGEIYRDVVLEAKEAGIPTFGKVEGVQDFADVDVHWERHAYETVDHVLCQGRNDADAIGGSGGKHIVGSSRLERIWAEEERRFEGDLAVINLNFTYEVLAEAREPWLDAAIEACHRAAVPYVISLHPQERPRPHDSSVATQPIRHLLTRASVLVSRFSTVPFEAMARGVPFVYFNPHGEKVPTFHQPDGAFQVATTVDELASAIGRARDSIGSVRSRAETFFTRQIDIDPLRPAEVRAADVIDSALSDLMGPAG